MKKFIIKAPFVTVALIGALIMTGCATKPSYQQPSSGPKIITNAQGVPNYHVVARGDTVSQVASRYRLNYRQIGALNGLDNQYTIYSGQYLKLWQGDENNYRSNSTNATSNNNQSTTSTPSANPVYDVINNAPLGYELPSRNQVVRNFDESKGALGMLFAGNIGDPVMASQGGSVMYAGNGLQEYGNLIMIRHSDNYITAYAHNSELLVKEGDSVQRGQRIASMGNSGQTNQVGLDFQVRLNGNPVDPRSVLGR
ncbi:peptidoglycan DD-metalloendopeptidase family protein [Psychrobacter sp. 16-MNA-CIBAN-0192]|uniref:peptidoglycan DD-metalloendopeptidase family protein n=1 Tax=Psychrobacter sp. 16-MNA-CIBAN-0192 TaxID=3140448 RepID=UPI00332DDD9A